MLIESEDPLDLVSSWETPDNCEAPGYGRVRIDNDNVVDEKEDEV